MQMEHLFILVLNHHGFMIKKHGGSSQWIIFDNKRGYNGSNGHIKADLVTEGNGTDLHLMVLNAGTTDNGVNNDGSDYFYVAFAEEPLVASNGDHNGK